ncbi:hypothetical protein CA2015_1048 [Cyclobacterium amurskyense]|jgi:hypothetical protein|uniref:ATP synthase protein I2 n=1 Tax=Cyclobacterium amurskyense TaxID=320787 RepID=A0A0H4PBL2_9BACT|nr:hypothetical protein CA2015_1048 [Cyclobacterium amurskyense]|tara:strand:+ start:31732 stop:32121 length:390 start_codon:yes stop_codon:yes gene_type:complete
MKALFKNPLLGLLYFTVFLAVIVWLIEQFLPGPWLHTLVYSILFFFAVLTGVTGFLAGKLMKLETFTSVSVILGTTIIRLICCIVFVFLILWQGHENLLWFVVDFFIIYLLYLLFDMYGLITNLRLHSK